MCPVSLRVWLPFTPHACARPCLQCDGGQARLPAHFMHTRCLACASPRLYAGAALRPFHAHALLCGVHALQLHVSHLLQVGGPNFNPALNVHYNARHARMAPIPYSEHAVLVDRDARLMCSPSCRASPPPGVAFIHASHALALAGLWVTCTCTSRCWTPCSPRRCCPPSTRAACSRCTTRMRCAAA